MAGAYLHFLVQLSQLTILRGQLVPQLCAARPQVLVARQNALQVLFRAFLLLFTAPQLSAQLVGFVQGLLHCTLRAVDLQASGFREMRFVFKKSNTVPPNAPTWFRSSVIVLSRAFTRLCCSSIWVNFWSNFARRSNSSERFASLSVRSSFTVLCSSLQLACRSDTRGSRDLELRQRKEKLDSKPILKWVPSSTSCLSLPWAADFRIWLLVSFHI